MWKKNFKIGLMEVVNFVQLSWLKNSAILIVEYWIMYLWGEFSTENNGIFDKQRVSHRSFFSSDDKKTEGSWVLALTLLFDSVTRGTNSFCSPILSVWLFNPMLAVSWMQMAAKVADTESMFKEGSASYQKNETFPRTVSPGIHSYTKGCKNVY